MIHCGDCLEIMRGMETGSIDAVVTDPPYSSGGMFRGDRMAPPEEKYVYSDSKRTCRAGFSGDNKDQRSFLLWSILWMSEARRLVKPGGILACFTDWRQLPAVTDAVQCSGWVWRGVGTWWKPGIRMQKGRMSYSSEFVVYATHGVPSGGRGNPQSVISCPPRSGRRQAPCRREAGPGPGVAFGAGPGRGNRPGPLRGIWDHGGCCGAWRVRVRRNRDGLRVLPGGRGPNQGGQGVLRMRTIFVTPRR